MKTTWNSGIAPLVLAILATASPVRAQAPDTVRVLGIERTGDSVVVQIAADSIVAAVPSEPFHLGAGRTRIFLNMHGTHLAAPLDTLLEGNDGIALRAQQQDGSVRITADLSRLGNYGIERTENGVSLWITLAPVHADAGAPAVAPQAADERIAQRIAGAEPRRMDRAIAVLLSTTRDIGRAIASWNPGGSGRLALIAAFVVFTFLAWRLAAHRPVPAKETGPGERRDTPASRQGGLWAARTLAREGLDAGAIAQRTGLARDIASLVVARTRAENPAATGTNFRPEAATATAGAFRFKRVKG